MSHAGTGDVVIGILDKQRNSSQKWNQTTRDMEEFDVILETQCIVIAGKTKETIQKTNKLHTRELANNAGLFWRNCTQLLSMITIMHCCACQNAPAVALPVFRSMDQLKKVTAKHECQTHLNLVYGDEH